MKRRLQTGNQNWVRQRNLRIVFNYLWDQGQPVSLAELVKETGLNRSTMGSLVAQLQSWGLIMESGISDPRPGRPAVLVQVDGDGGRVIGVEIGVDFIYVVLLNLKGAIVWQKQIEISDNGDVLAQDLVLNQAQTLIQEAITQALESNCPLFGIGVGVPGIIDHTSGTVLLAPNLKWKNVPLCDLWTQRFRVPVVVAHTGNAAALGEQLLGVAQGTENFFYLNGSVGIGGGIVIDGKLYRGEEGFAGEIGHMTIVPDGPQCSCGNRGCLETFVGGRAITNQVRQAAREGRVPSLLNLSEIAGNPNAIKMKHVLYAAEQGDLVVLQILRQAGSYLGIGIANLINAFNPGLIVLGGTLSLAAQYILPTAQAEINSRVLAVSRKNVQIAVSLFKFESNVVGAASLILREILNDPTEKMQQLGFPVKTASNSRWNQSSNKTPRRRIENERAFKDDSA
jgi:glucokinase-like ROK family protein